MKVPFIYSENMAWKLKYVFFLSNLKDIIFFGDFHSLLEEINVKNKKHSSWYSINPKFQIYDAVVCNEKEKDTFLRIIQSKVSKIAIEQCDFEKSSFLDISYILLKFWYVYFIIFALCVLSLCYKIFCEFHECYYSNIQGLNCIKVRLSFFCFLNFCFIF